MTEPIIYGNNWAVGDVTDPQWTHHVEWEIYEIYGQNVETGLFEFVKRPEKSDWDEPVQDIADASVFATLTVKWDGCSHLNLMDNGYFHVCGYETWSSWNKLVTDLFRRSRQRMEAAGATVLDVPWPDTEVPQVGGDQVATEIPTGMKRVGDGESVDFSPEKKARLQNRLEVGSSTQIWTRIDWIT